MEEKTVNYWWVPILICTSIGYAYLSIKTNKEDGWIFLFWIYGAVFQLWPYVSRHSRDLLFDAFLFDILTFLFYFFGLIYFGAAENLNICQKIGIAIVFIGLALMKIKN